MKTFNLVITIIFGVTKISVVENVRVVPEVVISQEGHSYVLYLDPQKNVQPKQCLAVTNNSTYLLSLEETKQAQLINGENKINPNERMTSLGNDICGFKIDNISKDTPNIWQLILETQDGQNFTANANVILKAHKNKVVKNYVWIGENFQIICSEEGDSLDYCSITNNKGEKVSFGTTRCSYTVTISTLDDFGTWKCEKNFKHTLFNVVTTYEIIQKDDEKVVTWFNETKREFALGCSVLHSKNTPFYCLLERPDGVQLKLSPGLASERYTTLGTNTSASNCSLQIVKPLLASEKGLWKCLQKTVLRDVGAFILTSNDTNLQQKPKIPQRILVHVNKTLTMTCYVPYSSPYCYMRSPAGQIYPMDEKSNTALGHCTFSKTSNSIDNGTWFCGYGMENGEEDKVYQFPVYILESLMVKPYMGNVNTVRGSGATLRCTTKGIGDYPLKYCRFLSPNGKMYHISNDLVSKKMKYNGRGYQYGDCGIYLQEVDKEDAGIWSCIVRIGVKFESDEIYTNIHLNVNETGLSLASALGIAFGVVISALFFGIVIFKRYKKRGVFSTTRTFFNVRRNDSSDLSANSVTVADFIQPSNEQETP